MSLELLREASQLGVNLYEEHQRFVKSFDPRWRTDEQVRTIAFRLVGSIPTPKGLPFQSFGYFH